MASSSSSSSVQSDVRQYVAAYEYEGPQRYCNCRRYGRRLKAPRKTSWSDENPGRRYFVCRYWHPNHVKNKSCGYFEWFDDMMNDRARELLNNFKVENEILRAQIIKLEKNGLGGIDTEVSNLWEELKKIKKDQKKREEEIERAKRRRTVASIVCILSWVLLFVIWLK